jgi:hypothetical protein
VSDYLNYKNLRLKAVSYGFGWHEYDNPSTDDIGNILERLDEKYEKLTQQLAERDELIIELEKVREFYADGYNWENEHTINDDKWTARTPLKNQRLLDEIKGK